MSTSIGWLNEIKWDEKGLVPAIAQDEKTGRVLMFAWMNRQALEQTAKTNRAVYWSRSRNKLWPKGEESGHVQKVSEIRLDCDNDVILLFIEQVGSIACHTGRESCFYKKYDNGNWLATDAVIKNPEDIYKSSSQSNTVK